MNVVEPRFERNVSLFGRVGQEKLLQAEVAVVGCGGLGTHVIQQVAHLGIACFSLIDPGELKCSSRNRYIGSQHNDPIPGTPKVVAAKRLIEQIDPNIGVQTIKDRLESVEAFEAVKRADYTFGCLDKDGARFILNELCLAYAKPLIDLASDVPEVDQYGGRVAVVRNGDGCLCCLNLLDSNDVRRYLTSDGQLDNEAEEYGVKRQHLLPGTGPSVVSINGVVASLGVTEFLVMVTGLREPARLLSYYGGRSIVTKSKDNRSDRCYYCRSVYDSRENIERYLRRRS